MPKKPRERNLKPESIEGQNNEVSVSIIEGRIVEGVEQKENGLKVDNAQVMIDAWLKERYAKKRGVNIMSQPDSRPLWGDKFTPKIKNLGWVIGEQYLLRDKEVARYRWDYDGKKGIHVNIECFGDHPGKFVLRLGGDDAEAVYRQYELMTKEVLITERMYISHQNAGNILRHMELEECKEHFTRFKKAGLFSVLQRQLVAQPRPESAVLTAVAAVSRVVSAAPVLDRKVEVVIDPPDEKPRLAVAPTLPNQHCRPEMVNRRFNRSDSDDQCDDEPGCKQLHVPVLVDAEDLPRESLCGSGLKLATDVVATVLTCFGLFSRSKAVASKPGNFNREYVVLDYRISPVPKFKG